MSDLVPHTTMFTSHSPSNSSTANSSGSIYSTPTTAQRMALTDCANETGDISNTLPPEIPTTLSSLYPDYRHQLDLSSDLHHGWNNQTQFDFGHSYGSSSTLPSTSSSRVPGSEMQGTSSSRQIKPVTASHGRYRGLSPSNRESGGDRISSSFSQLPAQPSLMSFSHPTDLSRSGLDSYTLATGSGSNSPFPDNFPLPPLPPRSSSAFNAPMADLTPSTLAYPGMMYDNVPIPESSMQHPYPPEPRTGDQYASALRMYEFLLAAVPHIQPAHTTSPPTSGQDLESLLALAADAAAIVTQDPVSVMNIANRLSTEVVATLNAKPKAAKSPAGSKKVAPAENKNHKGTECLGCGATETPEWRRGPLGPRTLCNACGLVHMKLQRKKRKREEAEAAAKSKT